MNVFIAVISKLIKKYINYIVIYFISSLFYYALYSRQLYTYFK